MQSIVRSIGIDHSQGYFISEPRPEPFAPCVPAFASARLGGVLAGPLAVRGGRVAGRGLGFGFPAGRDDGRFEDMRTPLEKAPEAAQPPG